MKTHLILFFTLIITQTISAQYTYIIKADSVKLTNCDSSELIIENHTQVVPGFLYNTGRGRTIFKRPLTKLSNTLYLVGADSLTIPNAWVQGGNTFGTNGYLGTNDKNNLDFFVNSQRVARLDTLGSLLMGPLANSGYKLDIQGGVRFSGPTVTASVGDSYDIQLIAGYHTGFGTGVDGSMLTFGSVIATVGVNKAAVVTIPANSFLLGRVSPGKVTAIVDGNENPVFVVDGNGTTTINGGYNGFTPFGSTATSNAAAQSFVINGGRGTGSGAAGDIILATGNAQPAGQTTHTMTNRWWLKGGTGYLANTSTPTSSVDVTGTNGYSQFRMRTSYTPSSSTDTNGNTGDFSWDGNFFYIKTPAGWKRSALTSFS